MVDVCLVLMPYAAIERPSIALGLLKASLQEVGIESTVLYANIGFAEEIGLYSYSTISEEFPPSLLMGEWTFSPAAFPDFKTNETEFLHLVTLDSDNPEEIQQALQRIRRHTPSFIERVAQYILRLQPKIVACSSTFEQHCASLALLRELRQQQPDIITFMGGANCESSMGQVTQQAFPWVDFVISGEGDEVVPRLCQQLLAQGRDIPETELPYGVMRRKTTNAAIFSAQEAPRASITDLDMVVVPDYRDYFDTLRKSLIASYIDPGLPIETSRGCWWGQKQHCTFCGLNGQGMTYRSKSPERAIAEFAFLSQQYDVHKFQVVDNILDLRHINTVLPIFGRLEKPYTIFYETKANLNYAQMKQLAEAGIYFIQPGIESLHDSSLKLLKKGNTALMNVQLLKWARELGIRVSWNFLVNMPGESDAWYLETVKWLPWIFHLYPPSNASKIRYDRFSPYHEQCQDYGLDLRPSRAYTYVYPLSAELLSDFAYYFETTADGEAGPLSPLYGGEAFHKPGHQALATAIKQWQTLFWSQSPPLLSQVDEGEQLTIRDTRPCRQAEEWHLQGLAYWVYQCCDRAVTRTELLRALQKHNLVVAWDEVQPIIEELQAQRILLSLNDRFLSLAVKTPTTPLKTASEAPAGHINLRRYQQAIKQDLLKSKGFIGLL